MNNEYSEAQLVEQPAMELLERLGWTLASAANESLGESQPLGRGTRSEVVIFARLRKSLSTLNPKLPHAAIEAAVDELTRDRSGMSAVGANPAKCTNSSRTGCSSPSPTRLTVGKSRNGSE